MSKEPSSSSTRPLVAPASAPELPYDAITQAVKGIKFGVVQLIIQDGRIIQIDRTEKIRLI